MRNDGEKGLSWNTPIEFFPFSYLFCLYRKMFVDKSMIAQAQRADLHDYLRRVHPEAFVKTSANLYLRGNNSLVIHRGNYGYIDYATCETGNGIDFLMNYLGYSFQDAVLALSKGQPQEVFRAAEKRPEDSRPETKAIQLPTPAPFPHSRMYAFLMKRKIPKAMIDTLVRQKLVYQAEKTNNIVFVNPEQDYFEQRGTYTFVERAFHGCGKTKPDRFWYLKEENARCESVYITEAAIDAISLYLLHRKRDEITANKAYVSIGGVSNNATIDRLRTQKHVILAVDNDPAGELCRQRYRNLEYILPVHKDWNEDLCETQVMP